MKILLKNTSHGLVPMYDDDYDNKKRLKIGETYEASIKLARNIGLHRKYFAMINCAWSLQSMERQMKFINVEKFRKSLELSAGHSETVYNHKIKDFQDTVKSISFDKMDNLEFEELYKNVRYIIDTVFCKHISPEDFEKYLINF